MAHYAGMTDSDRRQRSPLPLRLVLVVALCTLLGVPVVAAMAASPDPSGAAQPNGPAASDHPDKGAGHGFGSGFGFGFGFGFGQGKGDLGRNDGGDSAGRGGVKITAIAGDQVSLTTDDGWTRTITVTAATAITKGGATITVKDLAVGDEIGFHQTKNSDGTYTVTAITVRTPTTGGEVTGVTSSAIAVTGRDGTKTTIEVTGSTAYLVGKAAGTKADVVIGSRVLADGTLSGATFTATRIVIVPSVTGGEVTAKTSSTITVKGRDGKTATIHVDSKTTFRVRGKVAATLADIAVGDIVIATGTNRADGSLNASQVGGGSFKWGKHDKPQAPGASASP